MDCARCRARGTVLPLLRLQPALLEAQATRGSGKGVWGVPPSPAVAPRTRSLASAPAMEAAIPLVAAQLHPRRQRWHLCAGGSTVHGSKNAAVFLQRSSSASKHDLDPSASSARRSRLSSMRQLSRPSLGAFTSSALPSNLSMIQIGGGSERYGSCCGAGGGATAPLANGGPGSSLHGNAFGAQLSPTREATHKSRGSPPRLLSPDEDSATRGARRSRNGSDPGPTPWPPSRPQLLPLPHPARPSMAAESPSVLRRGRPQTNSAPATPLPIERAPLPNQLLAAANMAAAARARGDDRSRGKQRHRAAAAFLPGQPQYRPRLASLGAVGVSAGDAGE